MTFKLSHPPIIEAWIQATMVPTPETEWDWGLVDNVLRSFGGDLEEIEMLPGFTREARKFEKDSAREMLIRVEPRFLRVRNKQKSNIVQIGHNELVVNVVRQDDEHYPGFTSLSDKFIAAFNRYCEHIPVQSVQTIELHWADLIVIPQALADGKELCDFFVGAPTLPPEPFGITYLASWSATFQNPKSGVLVQLEIEMQPRESGECRFRMDWHAWSPEVEGIRNDAILEGLNSAHIYVLECFRAIFQPEIWQLFGPYT